MSPLTESVRLTLKQQSVAPLLLDTYSGAAAAYSLRRLTWAYGGPVVRVRRSSDNTEQDFTAAQVADGTLTTFCGAGDGFVRTWYDQSGNGNHAGQSVGNNQPQIVSSGTLLQLNSKPAIRFDGTNDSLELARGISSLNPWSVFALHTNVTGKNSLALVSSISDTVYSALRYVNNIWYGQSTTRAFSEGVADTVTQRRLITTVSTISTYAAYKNGTSFGNSSGGSYAAADFNRIGVYRASQFSQGDIQEMIVYSLDQSSSRGQIESNLNSYYAIY